MELLYKIEHKTSISQLGRQFFMGDVTEYGLAFCRGIAADPSVHP